ncbi:hypothetical protein ISF9_065 [Microbacterium phage vB_MoxS-ISF9]|uniref:Uncharacterized protein n=1 Tax=Microbacterium phage vB_MoxS-ISF9 TaxID=1458670 RepID=W8NNL7_9CAUD|nr:hypothetical protein ISF9_065 [Microbacterium phage vB_MoxS-ISF9]AHL18535.1 hypothetical protein ISF9_065 [Microbacterium phage vB_MoxS-ISF9]
MGLHGPPDDSVGDDASDGAVRVVLTPVVLHLESGEQAAEVAGLGIGHDWTSTRMMRCPRPWWTRMSPASLDAATLRRW